MALCLALFAEALKGRRQAPERIRSLDELLAVMGLPKEEKAGLNWAVQALLYRVELLFFRVAEEGFALEHYLEGLSYLEKMGGEPFQVLALPGVGSWEIIEKARTVCKKKKSFLIMNEQDLYDCLTVKKVF
ncbi:MAG: hypothetical protein WC371_05605 [Parachlamydiales bacterium]